MNEPKQNKSEPIHAGVFADRHIGPGEADVRSMLETLGFENLEELIDRAIPRAIRSEQPLDLPEPRGEQAMLGEARELAGRNEPRRPFIGMGYHHSPTPAAIKRNILDNPGWYTAYTPYQAELAQGRLEALLNFQTMTADLTGLGLANASLLDEATAAAEAMTLCVNAAKRKRRVFLVDRDCHPQTIAVVRARARFQDIDVRVVDPDDFAFDDQVCGVIVQYPATDGRIRDFETMCSQAHDAGAMVVMAADLLALTLLRPPGELGADVAVGSTQRFGIPLGYGGPHAAYFATREVHKRRIPGRIVGVSRDTNGRPALRMALQTREQHIRRDRATSNICTSQVLLAVMASMYAVYHGPEGLRRIARGVKRSAEGLAEGLRRLGFEVDPGPVFDTVKIGVSGETRRKVLERADRVGYDLRQLDDEHLTVTVDEATTPAELDTLLEVFGGDERVGASATELVRDVPDGFEEGLARTSDYLTHPIFHRHRSEHGLLRYMNQLQERDLSLTHSMIPLGSCTMKLNAAAEMLPIGDSGFADVHPFSDARHLPGYHAMMRELESMLSEITGLSGVSLQPNAGAQGEYAGLLAIRSYHDDRGESQRHVCLIPSSAHGTNPASAVMAGMKTVTIACDDHGNVDLDDLRAKAEKHSGELAALMVTYPSTHGVFEEAIQTICRVIHDHGGQVYMDGANMNAMMGLCRPGELGVDVCHLNLHKTFCIPHGGGGPGVGPIAMAEHLRPYKPTHNVVRPDPEVETASLGERDVGPVAAAPWGSPGILPISWMFIRMMGRSGLQQGARVAILNANYVARRLDGPYQVLYTNPEGFVAHEFIVDLRPFKKSAGVGSADVAKRLQDYGFHAPTMSFPVEGTFMIEPTESEPKEELDRFVDAMLRIREEIREIEEGRADREDNLLQNAPHTVETLTDDSWERPYTRREAGFPAPWIRDHKFWPAVSRIDDAWGDRNLVTTCPTPEQLED